MPKHITYAKALVAALDKAKGKHIQERMRNFLLLLKKRGDLKRLPGVIRTFNALWSARGGRVLEVVSAEPLSKSSRSRVLRLFPKKKISLQESLEPRLIAGAAVFLGKEYLFDGTLREKLRRMFII
ncbi:MAG: F0F1 ATP synthase subunit delta [bacterium]|nr:F0F1 ATP synthase subunit delta [bacterium]